MIVERLSNFEERSKVILNTNIESEQQRKNNWEKTEQVIKDLWNNTQRSNIQAITVTKGKKKDSGEEVGMVELTISYSPSYSKD
jgi:hypothetical protein